MKNYTIEQPHSSKWIELLQLWETSVRKTHLFLTEKEIVFIRSKILTEYFPQVDLYIIRQKKRIAAFLGVSKEVIEMLFVHPDYFGLKMGTVLVKFAIEQLKISKVEVNEQNLSALAFYQKMGFKVIGRTPLDHLGKPYPLLQLSLAH